MESVVEITKERVKRNNRYSISWNGQNSMDNNGNKYEYQDMKKNGDFHRMEINSDTHHVSLYSLNEQVDIEEIDILNLDDAGDRWEGWSRDGVPFGYGCLYGGENNLVYCGYMFEGKKVRFGMVSR